MTACPIRYQRQVSDRKGKIFYTSITSLSHISKNLRLQTIADYTNFLEMRRKLMAEKIRDYYFSL